MFVFLCQSLIKASKLKPVCLKLLYFKCHSPYPLVKLNIGNVTFFGQSPYPHSIRGNLPPPPLPNHPVLTSDSHNWPHYRFNKTYPATYFRTVLGLTDFGMLVKSFNPGSFCLSLHHFARAGRAHKTLSPS